MHIERRMTYPMLIVREPMLLWTVKTEVKCLKGRSRGGSLAVYSTRSHWKPNNVGWRNWMAVNGQFPMGHEVIIRAAIISPLVTHLASAQRQMSSRSGTLQFCTSNAVKRRNVHQRLDFQIYYGGVGLCYCPNN